MTWKRDTEYTLVQYTRIETLLAISFITLLRVKDSICILHHFYSILMDSSTDKEQVENELFVILYCEKDDVLLELKTTARYYCVLEPRKTDADGLVECLGAALKGIGIDNLLERENIPGVDGFLVLVGCATDGASVNVAEQNGMKGKLQAALP